MLRVSGRGTSQVCVHVPPVLLQKILDAPPDKLQRSSGETQTDLLSVLRRKYSDY